MSRRGSVVGASRSTATLAASSPFHSLVTAVDQHAALNEQPLSDPEDGEGWSDDDDDDEDDEDGKAEGVELEENADGKPSDQEIRKQDVAAESRGRTPTRSEATGKSESTLTNQEAPTPAKKSTNVQSAATTSRQSTTYLGVPPDHYTSNNVDLQGIAMVLDRKRAVSSSSAFGSRARVKQHNTVRRRRPLSFQQAIESLLLDHSKDFCRDGQMDMSSASQHSLLLRAKTADVGVDTSADDWRSEGRRTMNDPAAAMMEQNSAPAEFSQPNTPSARVLTSAVNHTEVSRSQLERKAMPPPPDLSSRLKITQTTLDTRDTVTKAKKKDTKFFMAGQSVDDSASDVAASSLAPSQISPTRLGQDHCSNVKQRAPSEAESDASHHHAASSNRVIHPKSHHSGGAPTRVRSGLALNRALTGGLTAARGKRPGRVASGGRGAKHHSEAATEQVSHQHLKDKPTMETKTAAPEKARVPVKFTMGGSDADDDDEFTDESSDGKGEQSSRDTKHGEVLSRGKDKGGVNEDDEWSSASSTDSEKLRKREKARRKKEEVARQQEMFQKQPIRSASTADVRSVGRRLSAPVENSNGRVEAPSPVIQPVRGLLSSLFHPEEDPHPPPGQLAGRPHASAADLRQRPSRLSDSRHSVEEGGSKASRIAAMPSTTQVPSVGGGVLKLSKSAVALPVLSTMGSRSEAKGSNQSAVLDDEEESEDGNDTMEHQSSEALARLNQLAFQKKEKQREGKRQSKKRHSNHSLNVEVAPEIDDESIKTERREAKREAVAMPSLNSHRSGSLIPETSMPQTPRTTRRNMLRDELSESLRQNLLWERQSRNRMLGIGALNNNVRTQAAIDSRSRSQVAPMSRNHTVLGGGPLRPLTSSSSVTNMMNGDAQQQQQQQRRSRTTHQTDNSNSTSQRSYTGDFHHAGW